MYADAVILLVMSAAALVAPAVSLARTLTLRQEFDRLAPVWRAWAQGRGYTFVDGKRSLTSPQSPQVRGRISPQSQALWTLDTMDLDPAAIPIASAEPVFQRQAYTVIAGRALTHIPATVVVRNRQLHGHLVPPQGYRAMDLSDALFDELCQVLTDDERVARTLLDPRTRKALVVLAQRAFVFTCVEGAVWIRWPRRETDPALLDAGVEALVGACVPRGGALPWR